MRTDRIITMTESPDCCENLVECTSKGEVILITRRRKPAGFIDLIALGRTIHSEPTSESDRHSAG